MVDRWINFYYLEQINQVYISHFIYFNLGEKKNRKIRMIYQIKITVDSDYFIY